MRAKGYLEIEAGRPEGSICSEIRTAKGFRAALRFAANTLSKGLLLYAVAYSAAVPDRRWEARLYAGLFLRTPKTESF